MSNSNKNTINVPSEVKYPEINTTAGRRFRKLHKIKNLFSRTFTGITVDDASITFTVIKASSVKRSVSEPLPAGIVSDGVVVFPDLLAKKVREIIKKNKIKTGRVVLGLSGLHAITKMITLPAVPRKLLADAISHEAERELPVSVDTVYLSWKIIEQSFVETKVFLVAYNRNVIDSLIKTLGMARINHFVMEFAPLSLTRLVDSPNAAIFNVRPGELDIVITSFGIPEVLRCVPLLRDRPLEDNLSIIREELERTILFYEPEKPAGNISVFGFGELSDSARDFLSSALNSKITSPLPTLVYPAGYSLISNAVNLSLLIQKHPNEYPKVTDLDLVPAVYRKPLLPDVLVISGTVSVLALLIFSIAQYAIAADRTGSYRDQLSAAQKAFTERQAQVVAEKKALSNFGAQVSQVNKHLITINTSMLELTAQRTSIDNDLQTALKLMSAAMTLSNVQHADNLVLQGKADSEAAVLSYVRSLEKNAYFKQILLSMQDAAGSANTSVDFRLELRTGG